MVNKFFQKSDQEKKNSKTLTITWINITKSNLTFLLNQFRSIYLLCFVCCCQKVISTYYARLDSLGHFTSKTKKLYNYDSKTMTFLIIANINLLYVHFPFTNNIKEKAEITQLYHAFSIVLASMHMFFNPINEHQLPSSKNKFVHNIKRNS